jgi:hypothetical protein
MIKPRINPKNGCWEIGEEDKSGSQESTKETGNHLISWIPGFQISLQTAIQSSRVIRMIRG